MFLLDVIDRMHHRSLAEDLFNLIDSSRDLACMRWPLYDVRHGVGQLQLEAGVCLIEGGSASL